MYDGKVFATTYSFSRWLVWRICFYRRKLEILIGIYLRCWEYFTYFVLTVNKTTKFELKYSVVLLRINEDLKMNVSNSTSSIYAHQNLLNSSAHNIANINTENFERTNTQIVKMGRMQ